MKLMKSYVKQILGKLTGDPSEVIAQKNYRKADAAVQGQIQSLKGKLVDAEGSLETAEENLNAAKYPTTEISDREYYIRTIVSASKTVELNKETVNDLKESIVYFETLLSEFNEEV